MKLRGESSIADSALLDSKLVNALLEGDENAFGLVVKRYNRAMIRLAMAYVPSRAVAEEVAQDAWMAMVQGLAGFKGQSSLKTWLFGILLNRAKTKGSKERRSVAFSAIQGTTNSGNPRNVDDRLFLQNKVSGQHRPVWGRSSLGLSPEDRLLGGELQLCLEKAISSLPPAQRAVIVLRDVEGWSSREVCELLGISPENQRVRLHRARLKMRSALDGYLRKR